MLNGWPWGNKEIKKLNKTIPRYQIRAYLEHMQILADTFSLFEVLIRTA